MIALPRLQTDDFRHDVGVPDKKRSQTRHNHDRWMNFLQHLSQKLWSDYRYQLCAITQRYCTPSNTTFHAFKFNFRPVNYPQGCGVRGLCS